MQDNPGFQKEMKAASNDEALAQLDALRDIVVGSKIEQSAAHIRAESRKMVSDVLTEAMHDREEQDGSVQRIIQPIVAKSLEKSLKNQRKDFIDYLYPLVGSLVRKSVAVFFTDFIEKTNDIIENSFTVRGLTWRVNAWRAGISFSEYVASQTFLFKVEQVFLIHRETGNLLRSVSADSFEEEDADLVSSMLSAINDFVADSFNTANGGQEQNLDSIKTDGFTLIIRQGPHAILVAAVTGNISRQASNQLQITLEEIQRIYLKNFKEYEGDSTPFETSDALLQDCLLSEVKDEDKKSSKKPIFGWIFLLLILGVLSWYSYGWWQTTQTVNKINDIDKTPGLVIQSIYSEGRYDIKLNVLRDPAAQSVEDWLIANNLKKDYIAIAQTPFISMDTALIRLKVERVINLYDSVRLDTDSMSLFGTIDLNDYQTLKGMLRAIPGSELLEIDSEALAVVNNAIDLSDNVTVNEQLFIRLIGDISSMQIGFASGDTSLLPEQSVSLDKVSEYFINIERLAVKLNRSANLVIVGASDSTGDKGFNQRLSQQRALVVREALIERGLKPEYIFSVGIGEIELPGNIKTTRKVLFNVMFAELND